MARKSLFSKKLKLGLMGLAALTTVGAATLFLASCSDNSSLTADDLVSTGDGKSYVKNLKNGNNINYNIKTNFENALLSRTPLATITIDKINEAWLSIIDKLIEVGKNEKFKIEKNNEWKKIDTNYDDLVKNLKDSNPDDWEIILQKDTLDHNGGTEESYKNKQKLAWASTYLSSKIFEKSYLRVKVGNKILDNPTQKQITEAANNFTKDTSKATFVFDSRSEDNGTGDDQLSKELFFADIQEYVFDLWMKIQQPFVVNMSLWKYGTPKDGLDQYYKLPSSPTVAGKSVRAEGETPSEGGEGAAGAGPSYNFPYFQNGIYDASNDTFTTVEKFQKFVEFSKTTSNFQKPNINGVANDLGIIDIPQEFTEDSSTYILAKRETIFNDLYPEFAAASMALLEDKTMPKKAVDAAKKNNTEFDTITSNFISTTKTDKSTEIPKEVVENVLAAEGRFKGYRNAPLYSLDAFKSSDSSLNEFAFLRNEAGVHAISIDGLKHIKTKNANIDEKIEAMKFPILYRAMLSYKSMEPIPDNPVFALDLKSELLNFFNSNTPLIMISLLNDVTSGDTSKFTGMESILKYVEPNLMGKKDSKEQKLFETERNLAFIEKMLPSPRAVQDKFLAVKQPFNAAYGEAAPNNGFAAQWVYNQNAKGIFEVAETYTQQGGKTITSMEYASARNQYNAAYDAYNTAVKEYVAELDKDGAFIQNKIKNTQIIWANKTSKSMTDIVNTVNYSYMTSNATDFSIKMKNLVLEKEIKDLVEAPANAGDPIINPSSWTDATATDGKLFTLKAGGNFANLPAGITVDELSKQFLTYLGNKEFQKIEQEKRFKDFTFLVPTNQIAGKSFLVTPEQLETYKKMLYINTSNSKKVTDNELTKNLLYTGIATLNYVLRDNGRFFINNVQSKLSFGEDAFIVWEDRFNSKYDNYKNNTTNEALSKDRLIINNDNNVDGAFNSKYTNETLPSNATNTNNTNGESLYGAGDTHYNFAGDKLGYKGFQPETGNALGTKTAKKLFEEVREPHDAIEDYTGILFKYGNKESLLKKVKIMTSWSQIKQLIEDINKDFKLEGMDNIYATTTPEAIQDAFEKNVIPQIPDSAFKRFEGTLTDKPFSESPTTTFKVAVYAKQLNYLDFTKVGGDPNGDDIKTIDQLKANIGDDLFYEWLMEAAFNETNQNVVINEIASKNKFTIYDINAKNALGNKWVENWLLPSELKNEKNKK